MEQTADRHQAHVGSGAGRPLYVLWKGGVDRALAEFNAREDRGSIRSGFAAVLPNQRLKLQEMDALEEAGLLVIQVPSTMRRSDQWEIESYVNTQIDDVIELSARVAAESVSLAKIAKVQQAAPDLDGDDAEINEAELLRSINDPDADEGMN